MAATGSALHKDMLKAWTPENKNTYVPRMNINDQYTNRLTDRFWSSSDYLSLQNITFGYTCLLYTSIRSDESSKFHPDHRRGTFWSVGGSWLSLIHIFNEFYRTL